MHRKKSSVRTLYGMWRQVWKRSLSKYPNPVPPSQQPVAMARRAQRVW